MKFLESDYDWSDWHHGLSPERKRRYHKLLCAIPEALPALIHEVMKKSEAVAKGGTYEVDAIVPPGMFATGVRGDKRSYCPVVFLDFLGTERSYEDLQKLSTAITNALPVGRVCVLVNCRIPLAERVAAFRERFEKTPS